MRGKPVYRAGETGSAHGRSLRVYPRPCGGNDDAGSIPARAGETCRVSADSAVRFSGSIPARAGETGATNRRRVYPRPCGGNQLRDVRNRLWVYPRPCGGLWGLSPPVRGKHADRLRWSDPILQGLSPPVRGTRLQRGPPPASGLSPPVRGRTTGLSPPVRGKPLIWQRWVYPRPCGGNGIDRNLSPPVRPCWAKTIRGLSPPVRGKPVGFKLPAEANWDRVYPRPCGGNTAPAASAAAWSIPARPPRGKQGLSPPVRGKRAPNRAGSIPARAGETGRAILRVYPRPCGGNSTTKSHQCCHLGTILTRSGVTKVLVETIFALRAALHRRPRSPSEALRGFRCGDCRQPVHRARP